MKLEVIDKNGRSGVLLAKTGFVVTAALSAISAAALPNIKAVGLGLLGAAAKFAWPATLIIFGALALTALIAFVAYKVLEGTEEGNSELAQSNERVKERIKREAQESHELMKDVEPRKIVKVVKQQKSPAHTVNNFKDIEASPDFSRLLDEISKSTKNRKERKAQQSHEVMKGVKPRNTAKFPTRQKSSTRAVSDFENIEQPVEDSKPLAEINKRAKERKERRELMGVVEPKKIAEVEMQQEVPTHTVKREEKESQQSRKYMEGVEPKKIVEVVTQPEEPTCTVSDFEDIGPAAEFRKLLMDNQYQNYTSEEIDPIFQYIKKRENLLIELENTDHHRDLLWIVLTHYDEIKK